MHAQLHAQALKMLNSGAKFGFLSKSNCCEQYSFGANSKLPSLELPNWESKQGPSQKQALPGYWMPRGPVAQLAVNLV
jgi:hypothetical protein